MSAGHRSNDVDRFAFGRGLAEALASARPVEATREFLARIMVRDPSAWDADDARTIRSMTELIEGASGNESRLLSLARDLQQLAVEATSIESVETLARIVFER